MNFPGSPAPRYTSQLEADESAISKIPSLERGVKKLELENLGTPVNHSTPVGDKKKKDTLSWKYCISAF